MPDFLVEDPSAVYFLLVMVGLVLAFLFWQRRQRQYLIGLGVVALLFLAVWLLNYFVVTDSEQIVSIVKQMAVQVPNKEFDAVFSNVSDDFQSQGVDKARLRQYVEMVKERFEIHDVPVWDFEVMSLSRADRKAKVRFFFKPKGNFGMDHHLLCTADFVLDPDNKWRIKSFAVSNPLVNVDDPMQWPEL